MLEQAIDLVRRVDWGGYHVSAFEVLLVVYALIRKLSFLSLLILGIVLGRGFLVVQEATNFGGGPVELVPFAVYTACAVIFFIYAMLKLLSEP